MTSFRVVRSKATPLRLKNASVLTDRIRQLMEIIWKDSARVFVEEFSKDILVETGESVGSLEPLARFVGASLRFRAGPKDRKRRSLNPRTGVPTSRIRSFASGVQLGAKAFRFRFEKTKFVFTFSIPVYQLFLQDTGRVRLPDARAEGASVRALQKQREAAQKEFRRRIVPLIGEWLATGRVKTSGN